MQFLRQPQTQSRVESKGLVPKPNQYRKSCHGINVSQVLILTLVIVFSQGPLAWGATLSGTLTGDLSEWGTVQIQALPSRDFSDKPIATFDIGPNGKFELNVPDDVDSVYLVLWPTTGAMYPTLLSELPFSVATRNLTVPVRAPPLGRINRHTMKTPGGWPLSIGLIVLILAVMITLPRVLPIGSSDRWLPVRTHPTGSNVALSAVLIFCGGLLGYGVIALDESMDLLEYTYFQEAFSAKTPWGVALSPVVAERAHAPGYAVLLWAMTSVSQSEIWLRIPAVLSALFGAFCLHRLTLQATGNPKAASIAALFGTITPLSMRYARDITPYSLVGCMAVLTTWLLYRALTSGDRRNWIGYAAASTTAFFLHYFAAFLIVGHFAAVAWLWFRGGRGPEWTSRFKQAVLTFGSLSILPALWAPQILRSLIISEQDNIVTRAIYLESPGFLAYVLEHLRVLFGLPAELSWAVWPVIVLVIYAYWVTLRDHPVLGRLLLIPATMIAALISLVYVLHLDAFGDRIYYGWRWLRPYTMAIAIPVACLAVKQMPRPGRAISLVTILLLVSSATWAGTKSALNRERPAQRTAAQKVLSEARDGDVLAVLPAAFYTVGWSYYLHDGAPKSIHPGPSRWDYFKRQNGHVKLFGPIRSFGIPLETVAEHVDIHRLWVAVYNESIFGQPEFEPEVSSHVLADLDRRMTRLKTWRYPYLDLVLYTRKPISPWTQGGVTVSLDSLYKSIRWIPSGLDPDSFSRTVRGTEPLHLRFPSPTAKQPIRVTIEGSDDNAVAGDVTSKDVGLIFSNGKWEGTIRPQRSDTFDLRLSRSENAMKWPLKVSLQ